jgi:hypothetical protein
MEERVHPGVDLFQAADGDIGAGTEEGVEGGAVEADFFGGGARDGAFHVVIIPGVVGTIGYPQWRNHTKDVKNERVDCEAIHVGGRINKNGWV